MKKPNLHRLGFLRVVTPTAFWSEFVAQSGIQATTGTHVDTLPQTGNVIFIRNIFYRPE